MTADYLARVVAIAERETAKASAARDGQPIPPIPGVNNAPERPTSARAGRQARVVATDRAGARHGSGNGLGGGV